MSNKRLLGAGLCLIYAAWLTLPAWAFFSTRGGFTVLSDLNARDTLQVLFPLFGLYAFMLLMSQILLATNLWWLGRIWPRIIHLHRYQGAFTLALAITHPLTILISYGISTYLTRGFVAPAQKVYLLPAYLGLTILLTTVSTAAIAWYTARLSWWRKLHRLNYLAFILLWIHSWFIGIDTQTAPLKFIWIGAPVVIGISIALKYKNTFLRWLEA